MANETISTNIAGLFPADFVSREVGESLQASVVIAPNVWIERESESTVVKFGFLPVVTPASFTEGTGMSLTQFVPTSTTVTVANVGSTVRVSGMASTLRPQVLAEVAQEQGKGLGAKIDTDLAALFASFTNSVGATTTAMTTTYWLSAIAKLNALKVPQTDRVGILSAMQYQDLLNSTQVTNGYAYQQAAHSGGIGTYFGVPVLMSQVLATANTGADDVGGIFNRRAIGLGLLKDITCNIQAAPAQYNSTDIASVVYYGVAMLDAARGIKIIARNH